MAWFPKIERPCPYLDRLDSVMDGDFCRMCKRQVHDLTDMDDAGRAAFMAACGGDACVSYTAYVRPAVAAALVAASAAVLVIPGAGIAQRHERTPAQNRVPPPPPQVPVMIAGGIMPIPAPTPEPPKPETPPPPPAVKPN